MELKVCFECNGSGVKTCPQCGGGGGLSQPLNAPHISEITEAEVEPGTCPKCGGSGQVVCPICGGTGEIPDESLF